MNKDNSAFFKNSILGMMRSYCTQKLTAKELDALIWKAHPDEYASSGGSVDKIGNTLRVLKGLGIIRREDGGWVLNDKTREFVAQRAVKVLVSFPENIHEAVVQAAERQKVPRNTVITNAVAKVLKPV
jgi:hypothetical protein